MGVKRKIVVSIGYYNFTFDRLGEASDFASMAATHIDGKDRRIQMDVDYIQDDEAETDDTESEDY